MRYVVFALLWLATGCTQLGLPTPQTFNEKLAVGYSTVTAIRNTATTLLVAKKLSVEDAQNVQTQSDNLRSGLDIANKVHALDAAAGNDKLAAVQTALVALQAYLASKQ